MDRRLDQPGLRLRMGAESHRIRSQHRQLDVIFGRVVAAAERGAARAARAALERFRDAWDAHTSLEDGFYFPALRALRPALGARLASLSEEHDRLRERLEALDALLAGGDAEAIGPALEAFIAQVNDHEQQEEALLAELASGAA